MSRRHVISDGSDSKETRRYVVSNGVNAKVVNRALVSDGSNARQFWPPVVDPVNDSDWGDYGGLLGGVFSKVLVQVPYPFWSIVWQDAGTMSYGAEPSFAGNGPLTWATFTTTTSADYLIKVVLQSVDPLISVSGSLSGFIGQWVNLSGGASLRYDIDGVGSEKLAEHDIIIAREDPDSPGNPLAGTEETINNHALMTLGIPA